MPSFTPTVLRFDSLASTNAEAARLASEGAQEGLCVVAAEQTQGRGRLGRQWASPKGAGLYFSIVFRPAFAQSSWPQLTLMSAVAVHDALLESCDLQTDIKWPNDIVADEKKLCGILAETVDSVDGSAVVVGIGINLTQQSFPTELEGVATSAQAVLGRPVDLEAVLDHVVRHLVAQYKGLQQPNGSVHLVKEWCARSSYCNGKRIRVTDGAEAIVGTTRGLQNDGALIVELDSGHRKTIRSGDISSVRPVERDVHR